MCGVKLDMAAFEDVQDAIGEVEFVFGDQHAQDKVSFDLNDIISQISAPNQFDSSNVLRGGQLDDTRVANLNHPGVGYNFGNSNLQPAEIFLVRYMDSEMIVDTTLYTMKAMNKFWVLGMKHDWRMKIENMSKLLFLYHWTRSPQ